jgi:hypothetical protein
MIMRTIERAVADAKVKGLMPVAICLGPKEQKEVRRMIEDDIRTGAIKPDAAKKGMGLHLYGLPVIVLLYNGCEVLARREEGNGK